MPVEVFPEIASVIHRAENVISILNACLVSYDMGESFHGRIICLWNVVCGVWSWF